MQYNEIAIKEKVPSIPLHHLQYEVIHQVEIWQVQLANSIGPHLLALNPLHHLIPHMALVSRLICVSDVLLTL